MNTHFIILVLNCLLIQHNIQINNHRILESKPYTISKTYSQLHHQKINNNDYYLYNVKIDLIKKNEITIFSFVTKNILSGKKAYELLSDIKDTLHNSKYSIYIKHIYIEQLKKRNNKIIEVNFIY
jgi:hypothetical protein